MPETVPVTQSEPIMIGGREYLVRYEGEKLQRIEKALVRSNTARQTLVFNDPRIIWCPLPLELGDSMTAITAFYRLALRHANVRSIFTATPPTPSVLILPSVFRDVVLYTFVSESARDTRLTVTHLETKRRFNVLVPAGRTAMVFVDR